MKAGVSCYCFNALLVDGAISLAEIVRFLGGETEAQCIEPLSRYWADGAPEAEQAAAFREQADAAGLTVSCYTLDSNFAVYDAAAHQQCIDECVARLETARVLGTDTIRLDPRTSLPMPADEADGDEVLARMASGMAAIADAAGKVGVKVGVENHGRLVGRIEQVARLVELVGRPNFGVNIDPTNFRNVHGQDHIAATRTLAPFVVHAHLKDFYTRDQAPNDQGWREIPTGQFAKPAAVGDGDTGAAEMIAILRDAGYDGAISIEVSEPDDIHGSVARGVANVRRIIAELGA